MHVGKLIADLQPAQSRRTRPEMFLSKGDQELNSCARWLTVSEFSAEYQVTPWTARRWARSRLVKFIRLPPGPRGQMRILDPRWQVIDPLPTGDDPIEWWCGLRQCDVAELLGITPRTLRYWESAGKTNYRLVGRRKYYSISAVRALLARQQMGREQVTRSERQRAFLDYAQWKLGIQPENQRTSVDG